MDPGSGNVPPFFEIAIAVVALLFLVAVVVIVIGIARSRRVLRESGLDPLAARAQIAARVSRGPLATPAKSLEQRLGELDDLHRRGVITDAEHDAARTAALEGRR
jgi:hypothetical protein